VAERLRGIGRFQASAELFIQANKPELAVKAYKENQAWTDALRVTKDYMPTAKYNELLAEYQRFQSGGGSSGTDITNEARRLEGEGQYSEAVDEYLKVTRATTTDQDHLEKMWFSAVNLTINHVPARLPAVAKAVSDRLCEIGRYDQAAELYEGIDFHQQALEVYAKGGLFDKARQLAAQAGPKYSQYVQELYVQHLQASAMDGGDAGELMGEDETAGLEVYVRRGEWERVFEAAQRQGPAVYAEYTLRYAAVLSNDQGNPAQALQALMRGNSPYVQGQVVVYNKIAREMLGRGYQLGSDEQFEEACNQVKQCLYSLVVNMGSATGESEEVVVELQMLLVVAHLVSTRTICLEKNMTELAARISCSLCRYAGIIPADKVFYQAGSACMDLYKESGAAAWRSQGFLFLNR
jgi:intraflagellar transport protein 172